MLHHPVGRLLALGTNRRAHASPLLPLLLLLAGPGIAALDAQPLIQRPAHLGSVGHPEWDGFAGRTPSGDALDLTFQAAANAQEQTLLIRQADVKQDWSVQINGRQIGSLVRMETDLVHALAVPAGTLHGGDNTLRIRTRTPGDDILLHSLHLDPRPVATVVGPATLQVRVTGDDGHPMPARVTIVDSDGALAAVRALPGPRQAVRPGVAYTGGDAVRVALRPGTYRVRATRGPEYGMHEATVALGAGDSRDLALRLTREVDTAGWTAADTHIHTLELSGHGDASVAERALTLAGEGIDLAIATEHNRRADYAPALAAMGVSHFVTPVSGNEVTTAKGHFNVFPASGAVAILNHPHDTHAAFTPFARANFNTATGLSRGLSQTFTAIEVVNSGAMRSDWMQPIRSWFALLNRGLRITPIGASDSHDVSRFIVGQGRTYVRAVDAAAGRPVVDDAVESIEHGRVVVSLGLFTQARVGAAGPGDLVAGRDARTVEARVQGASWIRASRIALVINGVEAAQATVAADAAARVEKAAVSWPLPARRHDYFLVVIASGPGVTHPSWAIPTPYQPTTTAWSPVVFGLTAPIFVDADGDGMFTSARAYAATLVAQHGEATALFRALSEHDAVVSSHAAELLEERGVSLDGAAVRSALAAASRVVRAGVEAYLSAK